ncbi:hypothetical protein [Amazonocrinis nigriterrae]|uniref:hypothetical protein n=1 Tax=Amazonocrinis nigriterrae TaxID=2840443 RepID=UPI0018DD3C43|nr:hypothetical protein [Amazonocrinis nigriterrae]
MKSTFKSAAILFASFAAALSVCHSATAKPAGLDLGGQYRIPPGQEQELLQYQLEHNNDLRQVRVIPGCTTGFGLSCNKTGSVLEEIIKSNGGPSYEEMLIQAAGGRDNLKDFTGYYDNSFNVYQTPYISFWREQKTSSSILDSSQYVLGQSVSRTPIEGLGNVTKKFSWAPLTRGDNSLDPRSGLLDLKYSYGRVLLNEFAKISNPEQQIRSLNLPPDMTQYYLSTLSGGLHALKIGDEQGLQDSILKIFSFPYTTSTTIEYGRVPIGASEELALQPIPLAGEALDIEPILSEGADINAIPDASLALGDVVQAAEADNFPWWSLAGLLIPLAFLFGSDGNNSSGQTTPTGNIPGNNIPPITPNPSECIPTNGNSSIDNGQVVGVSSCHNPPVPDVKTVVEPSTLKALLLLTLMICIISRKQQLMPAKVKLNS